MLKRRMLEALLIYNASPMLGTLSLVHWLCNIDSIVDVYGQSSTNLFYEYRVVYHSYSFYVTSQTILSSWDCYCIFLKTAKLQVIIN